MDFLRIFWRVFALSFIYFFTFFLSFVFLFFGIGFLDFLFSLFGCFSDCFLIVSMVSYVFWTLSLLFSLLFSYCFHMCFLCLFPYGFPMRFLCVSSVLHMVSYVCFYGLLMKFLWIPMCFYGCPMFFSCSYVVRVFCIWFSMFLPMGFLCCCCGSLCVSILIPYSK